MKNPQSIKPVGTLLLDLLPFVGAFLAVLSPFGADLYQGADLSLPLLSSAIALFFPSLIRLSNEVRRVSTSQRAMRESFEQLLWLSDDHQRSLVVRAMRRGFFDGSEINDQFWLAYCNLLLAKNDDGTRSKEIIAHVFDAVDKQEIALSEDDAYHLMQQFCEVVFDEDKNYYATTTDEDVKNILISESGSPAEYFIFQFPKKEPSNLRRIFVLSSNLLFEKLPEAMKRDLAEQIKGGAQIFVLVHPNPDSINFGIYGDFAVGEYSERAERIRFRKVQAGRQMRVFNDLANRARPLVVRGGLAVLG